MGSQTLPCPGSCFLSSRARPWHRAWCTPQATLPCSPSHSSCKRSGPAGGTEVAHTVLGASPATRKAVVSDSVSNRTRSRVGDRSRASGGARGSSPFARCGPPARQRSERLGSPLRTRCWHWANWGSWSVACGSVTRMRGAGKRVRDFPSAPRMQTGMKTPWRCLMEPQPWLGREGEVRRAGAGTRAAERWHSVRTRALPCQPWEPRTLRNGGLSPSGPAQRTNRRCL